MRNINLVLFYFYSASLRKSQFCCPLNNGIREDVVIRMRGHVTGQVYGGYTRTSKGWGQARFIFPESRFSQNNSKPSCKLFKLFVIEITAADKRPS